MGFSFIGLRSLFLNQWLVEEKMVEYNIGYLHFVTGINAP